MSRLLVSLFVAMLLSGCEALMPVSGEETKGEVGRYIHRTDIGGYYRYDDGRVEVTPPLWR